VANIFDGRAKLVDATSKGKRLAERADAIPATPPSAPSALGDDELEELRRVLAKVRAGI
jgi:DNA-binding MarR family transcriptional regulator